MRIAPGILRDLRNLEGDTGPAQTTEEFIQRQRARRARYDEVIDQALRNLDQIDQPSVGDLQAEREYLQRVQAKLQRVRRWESAKGIIGSIAFLLFAAYTVLCTVIGMGTTAAWIFGQ